jgi:hypothetical protein
LDKYYRLDTEEWWFHSFGFEIYYELKEHSFYMVVEVAFDSDLIDILLILWFNNIEILVLQTVIVKYLEKLLEMTLTIKNITEILAENCRLLWNEFVP